MPERMAGVPRATTLRLSAQDRENADTIIRAGWADTLTGAIRYALTLAAKQEKRAA